MLKKNLALIIILISTCLIFSPVLKAGFLLLDDSEQITKNTDINNLSLPGLQKIFSSYYVNMYQPTATLSYALEKKFFGLKPVVFHFDNLLLHLINISLVYIFISLLLKKENSPAIYLTTAIFAIWPTQVEAVAWLSARSTLLSTMFILGASINYLLYHKNKLKKNYYLSLILGALAIISKSSAIIVPLLWLAIDYFQNQKISRKEFLEKIPLFILAIIISFLALTGRHLDLNNTSQFFVNKFAIINLAYLWQVAITFFPLQPSVLYEKPFDLNLFQNIWLWISLLIIPAVIIIYILLNKKKYFGIALGLAWFSLLILPSLQIMPYVDFFGADRYSYLAIIGPACLLAIFINKTCPKNYQSLSSILQVSTLTIIGILSWGQANVWHDNTSLFENAIKANPKSSIAHAYLGNHYWVLKLNDQAEEEYLKAIELNPSNQLAISGLKNIASQKLQPKSSK